MPKDFRSITSNFIVTRGLDGGLFVYKEEDFLEEARSVAQSPFTKKDNRDYMRLMANDAHAVSPDSNGRIQLPQHLIDIAELKKDLVFVGSISRAEIWDRNEYHKYLESVEPAAEEIAERVGTELTKQRQGIRYE